MYIEGFRMSDDQVAAFRFGQVADSYAAQTATDRNVGVIGLAFFAERGPGLALPRSPDWRAAGAIGLPPPEEIERRDTADPFPQRGYARPPGY
jgi:hypothetical protein